MLYIPTLVRKTIERLVDEIELSRKMEIDRLTHEYRRNMDDLKYKYDLDIQRAYMIDYPA